MQRPDFRGVVCWCQNHEVVIARLVMLQPGLAVGIVRVIMPLGGVVLLFAFSVSRAPNLFFERSGSGGELPLQPNS